MRYNAKQIKLKDGSLCILRSPEIDDAKALMNFLNLTAKETYYLSIYPEEVIYDIKKEQEIIEEVLNSHKDVMITAIINGEIAGNVGVRKIRELIKEKHRYGFGIAIIEKHWNKGLGNILIKEAIKIAKDMGYEQMELGVFFDNYKAKALYEKYGFEVWGVIKNAFKLKNGTYHDEIEMGKIL